MSDEYNSSLNTLLGSFTSIVADSNFSSKNIVDNDIQSICIDSSTNRIGINTLDPSYSIHINDTPTISGSLYVSELLCVSANIINNLDVSYINSNIIDLSKLDVSTIVFKDNISGPTLDVSLINVNTISGINLLFDISKIDISGTIDLSNAQFRPKFFIPDSSANVEVNQLYYDLSGEDTGILMIKLK